MTTKTNPLLDAADYIQDNGWCRSSWYNQKGQACLAGAVGLATGALVPLSNKEIERELKTYVEAYGYTPQRAETEIPRFKWSTAKTKLTKYLRAVTVLANEIDAQATASAQDNYAPSTYTWVPEEERQRVSDQAVRARVEGIVITRNGNQRDDLPRTTKTQAIKLLRKAAERY